MSERNIHQRMIAIAERIASEGIGKHRKGPGFKFRGIDEAMNAFAPLLAAEGVHVVPRFSDRVVAERQSKNGAPLFFVTLAGEFDFVSETGDKLTVGPFYGEAMDSGDKATNKAMAICYKYALFQSFCVPLEPVIGGDPDGEVHQLGDGVIADWTAKIEECDTVDALQALKPELSGLGLQGAALRNLRAVFTARLQDLKKEQQSAAA